ncbi:unnamed protein product [Danaus chrysippus]|uniref:(African queen) hypothetical protein n=1 Tax=Danaus chrysippus TaxID=151541 RepID=A0A8J2QR42_9NEOP|nr:unnamed protein product [Danaus chrysippus]
MLGAAHLSTLAPRRSPQAPSGPLRPPQAPPGPPRPSQRQKKREPQMKLKLCQFMSSSTRGVLIPASKCNNNNDITTHSPDTTTEAAFEHSIHKYQI